MADRRCQFCNNPLSGHGNRHYCDDGHKLKAYRRSIGNGNEIPPALEVYDDDINGLIELGKLDAKDKTDPRKEKSISYLIVSG